LADPNKFRPCNLENLLKTAKCKKNQAKDIKNAIFKDKRKLDEAQTRLTDPKYHKQEED